MNSFNLLVNPVFGFLFLYFHGKLIQNTVLPTLNGNSLLGICTEWKILIYRQYFNHSNEIKVFHFLHM